MRNQEGRRGEYQISEGRETERKDESKRHLRVGGKVPKKKEEKKKNAWNKQKKVGKGPGVKKGHSHLMGNKERDIWKEMDVPVMEWMTRDNRDRVYSNIARIMSTVSGAVEKKTYGWLLMVIMLRVHSWPIPSLLSPHSAHLFFSSSISGSFLLSTPTSLYFFLGL